MSFLTISTSLNKSSRSLLLAREAHRLINQDHQAEFLDLRQIELPQCDGDQSAANENVDAVSKLIQNATCILLAAPIYNYAASSAAKNLIELTGRAWTDKTVGFICAAGGRSSYMSIMSLAGSLMLDFRCLIIPRFVYADSGAFSGDSITDQEVRARLEQLVQTAIKLDGVAIPQMP
jgi:FMN reductase